MTRDYSAIAKQYAEQVVAGEVVACLYVRLACQRHLDDLQKTPGQGGWEYEYNEARAAHVCRFIELLPHVEGKWAKERKKIFLEPWQIFILCCVFGWIDDWGRRRFRVAYIEVPRKNAKSTLSAGVALYCLTADMEPGAQVYSAATTRDQAQIVWRTAKAMVEKTKGLQQRYAVATTVNNIFIESMQSFFRPLSRDQGGNHDGYNVHCAVVDELHAHKQADIWDVLDTATGAREQPLIWAITTAGFNRAGVCYRQRDHVIKFLKGVATDDRYFGIIFTIDEGDDWTQESSWAKANPNWGVSVSPEDIIGKGQRAMSMASAQNNFLTKHLNVWVNADTAWMDMQAWDAAEDDFKEEDFKGEKVLLSLDLASKVDIAAKIKLFQKEVDGLMHYYIRPTFYLPEDATEQGVNSNYAGWVRGGFITATPGNIIDFAYIESDICDDAARFDVEEGLYDPWQATYLATRLKEQGLNMVEYRQTVQNMSDPMKMLEAFVLSGRLHHDGNPVMTWMISNVVAHVDAKENIYPRKEFNENKIDGPVALIMALGRALVGVEIAGPSIYESRGIRTL